MPNLWNQLAGVNPIAAGVTMVQANKGSEEAIGATAQIPFIGKQVFGYHQYLKGLKQKEGLVRPEYEIPQEVQQNLTQAQLMALEGLPAEQKRQYIQNIQRSMTSNLAALTGRKAGLVGVSGLAQTEADAYGNLLGMDAQARQANQQQLMQQRALMGDQKALQWQINQMQPYLQSYGEAQGLIGAGTQNMAQGSQELTKTATDVGTQLVKLGMM